MLLEFFFLRTLSCSRSSSRAIDSCSTMCEHWVHILSTYVYMYIYIYVCYSTYVCDSPVLQSKDNPLRVLIISLRSEHCISELALRVVLIGTLLPGHHYKVRVSLPFIEVTSFPSYFRILSHSRGEKMRL